MLSCRDESAIWTTAVARYEQGLGAAFFAERPAETAQRRYAILPESETLIPGSENGLEFLYYSKALPQKSFEDFVQFVNSAFPEKNELQAEDNQAL